MKHQLHVVDKTHDCVPLGRYASISIRNVEFCIVHRLSFANPPDLEIKRVPDKDLCASDVARLFSPVAMHTGGQTPYHALIRQDGTVEQMLPLLVAGAHAVNHNWCSWGIAVAGNWDQREMPDRLWETLIETLAVLSVAAPKIAGHTELPDATRDPNKRCPGKHINMDFLRGRVAGRLPTGCENWETRQRLRYVVRAGFAL